MTQTRRGPIIETGIVTSHNLPANVHKKQKRKSTLILLYKTWEFVCQVKMLLTHFLRWNVVIFFFSFIDPKSFYSVAVALMYDH